MLPMPTTKRRGPVSPLGPAHAEAQHALNAQRARVLESLPTKRPRGRPALAEDERRSHILKVRATQAEADKFERLGGAEWFRQALKRAKEPT